MFLKTLFLACFIERWPLNSIALMTSCGLLSTGGREERGQVSQGGCRLVKSYLTGRNKVHIKEKAEICIRTRDGLSFN